MTRAAFTEVSHDFSWEVLLEMLRERWSDIPDSAHIEPSYNCESDVDQVTGITVLWSENERMVELL